jgi:hypothetical protein
MVLATDDTSISVPHEKYFPGSQALYEEYIAALDKDFKSHGVSVGFVAKGFATEFIGVGIDQSQPGKIILDMRAVSPPTSLSPRASSTPTSPPPLALPTPFSPNSTALIRTIPMLRTRLPTALE